MLHSPVVLRVGEHARSRGGRWVIWAQLYAVPRRRQVVQIAPLIALIISGCGGARRCLCRSMVSSLCCQYYDATPRSIRPVMAQIPTYCPTLFLFVPFCRFSSSSRSISPSSCPMSVCIAPSHVTLIPLHLLILCSQTARSVHSSPAGSAAVVI